MTPGDIRDIWGIPATCIDGNLWQSGFPHPFAQTPESGVDIVVLTATEAQPDRESLARVQATYPQLGGIMCPFKDTEDQTALRQIAYVANATAVEIVEHLKNGRVVLVTCAAGRNRSGLISALTLMRWRGLSGAEAVRRVRAARDRALPPGEGALTNKMFTAYLESLPRSQ